MPIKGNVFEKRKKPLYFPIISPLACDECPSIEDRRAANSHHPGTLGIYALAERWPGRNPSERIPLPA